MPFRLLTILKTAKTAIDLLSQANAEPEDFPDGALKAVNKWAERQYQTPYYSDAWLEKDPSFTLRGRGFDADPDHLPGYATVWVVGPDGGSVKIALTNKIDKPLTESA